MSTPPFRSSRTLSRFPALAARRKLVLLSDWGEDGESDGWMMENERGRKMDDRERDGGEKGKREVTLRECFDPLHVSVEWLFLVVLTC